MVSWRSSRDEGGDGSIPPKKHDSEQKELHEPIRRGLCFDWNIRELEIMEKLLKAVQLEEEKANGDADKWLAAIQSCTFNSVQSWMRLKSTFKGP